MKQTKLLKAVLFAVPFYLTACTGVEGMFDNEGYQHANGRDNYSRMHKGKNTVVQETTDQKAQPQSTARSRTEAVSEQNVEVVPVTNKTAGPAVPVEAPSVSGM